MNLATITLLAHLKLVEPSINSIDIDLPGIIRNRASGIDSINLGAPYSMAVAMHRLKIRYGAN